jgi:hypothetical protein
MATREQGRRRTVIGAVVVTALLTLVGAAWLAESLLAPPQSIPPVVITRGGMVLAEYTIDELREFPVQRISQFGKWEEGPAVLDVLAASGVVQFERITVTGLGDRDSGSIELDASEMDRDVILDFANRGTVKVAGPDIPWNARVRDVTVLEVE